MQKNSILELADYYVHNEPRRLPEIINNVSGRNSKTVVFEYEQKNYIVKEFSPKAGTDNLEREVAFYKYLKSCQIRNTPELIAFNNEKNLIVLSFIEGNKISTIKDTDIIQSVQFLFQINKSLHKAKGVLGKAGGAIKNFLDHFTSSKDRINHLHSCEVTSDIEREMFSFVKEKLLFKWHELFENVGNIDSIQPSFFMPEIVSPSDFGFHNILKREKKLYFFDFEYGGFDDRFKLFCDFLAQPDYLLKYEQLNLFLQELQKYDFIFEEHFQLIKTLLPFYRLKWCCIVLNDFRKDKKDIRAHAKILNNNVLQYQLKKAKKLFKVYFN